MIFIIIFGNLENQEKGGKNNTLRLDSFKNRKKASLTHKQGRRTDVGWTTGQKRMGTIKKERKDSHKDMTRRRTTKNKKRFDDSFPTPTTSHQTSHWALVASASSTSPNGSSWYKQQQALWCALTHESESTHTQSVVFFFFGVLFFKTSSSSSLIVTSSWARLFASDSPLICYCCKTRRSFYWKQFWLHPSSETVATQAEPPSRLTRRPLSLYQTQTLCVFPACPATRSFSILSHKLLVFFFFFKGGSVYCTKKALTITVFHTR